MPSPVNAVTSVTRVPAVGPTSCERVPLLACPAVQGGCDGSLLGKPTVAPDIEISTVEFRLGVQQDFGLTESGSFMQIVREDRCVAGRQHGVREAAVHQRLVMAVGVSALPTQ
tara:strand:- start:138006 stop:138344 length:339 start_codon:yes stop_codon:yes gene_type:complete